MKNSSLTILFVFSIIFTLTYLKDMNVAKAKTDSGNMHTANLERMPHFTDGHPEHLDYPYSRVLDYAQACRANHEQHVAEMHAYKQQMEEYVQYVEDHWRKYASDYYQTVMRHWQRECAK